jgi:hypothetical protein
MDIREWFKHVVEVEKLMVAPLVFRRHAVFRNLSNPANPPYVAVNFDTRPYPALNNTIHFPRHDNGDLPRQFLSFKGEYVLAQNRNTLQTVHFADAHERLVPLGTFMLVARPAVNHFGISCSKTWLKGSLRYPEDAEPDEDDHQFHVYISVRVKTRANEHSVRVVHVHVENCRIMEGCGIQGGDISSEASPCAVQFHHQVGALP